MVIKILKNITIAHDEKIIILSALRVVVGCGGGGGGREWGCGGMFSLR